jgi:hypothetical protein
MTFGAGPRGGGGFHVDRRHGGARHFGWRGHRPGGGFYIGPAYPYYLYDEPYFYEDDYVFVPEYYGDQRTVEYCIRRFKSYNLATRTYRGFDGKRHPCP